MPNGICFPGGVFDKTDESPEWLDFFKKHNVNVDTLTPPSNAKRPFIFNDTGSNLISRHVSLRINAIRETFEEMGIVLCRDGASQSTTSSSIGNFYHTKSLDIPSIQYKIHNNHKSLLSFCEEFNIVPDITNVHDWSCWLTPTMLRPKRFETAFYLVALNSIPPAYPESHEVQNFSWKTPDELLSEYANRQIWLPPPQFVEMRRLSTIENFDNVVEVAKERNKADMELLMPLQFNVKDGMLHVLPGDDLYHEKPNYYESDHDINQYADEMRSKAKNLCRSEQKDLYDVKLYTNIQPLDGHVSIKSDEIPNVQGKL